MADWDPKQYQKFAEPRLQPAIDLLEHVPLTAPQTLCDLGCGTGTATRLLLQRWPRAAVTGVDSSASMLAQARNGGPGINWVQHDLESWRPAVPPDLIYSNAALHWLPRHEELLPYLLSQLTPAGVLAIQMPRSFSAPSHLLIAETVRNGPWRERLLPLLRPVPVEAPPFYYRLLEPLARTVTMWETEYLHTLRGADPVKEWVKGTWLSPLLHALEPPERGEFESAYAERLRLAYPPLPSGVTLFPFKRLFIVAQAR